MCACVCSEHMYFFVEGGVYAFALLGFIYILINVQADCYLLCIFYLCRYNISSVYSTLLCYRLILAPLL